MKKRKILSILCAAVMAIGGTFIAFGKEYKNSNKTATGDKEIIAGVEIPEETIGALESIVKDAVRPGNSYTLGKSISFLSTDIDPLNATSLTANLTATVYPEDAIDKSVDWSIAWADDSTLKDEPVANYVTVTPTSDGALTATVACLQPFGDNTIIIMVTTRDGGFQDSCTVSYVGVPVTITMTPPDEFGVDEPLVENTNEHFDVRTNVTYTFTYKLFDHFGEEADEEFYNYLALETSGPKGYIIDRTITIDEQGTEKVEDTEEILVDFGSPDYINNVWTVSFVDGVLSLKARVLTEKSWGFYKTGLNYTKWEELFAGWYTIAEENAAYYFTTKLVLNEIEETYIKFGLYLESKGVEGVSLDNTKLKF